MTPGKKISVIIVNINNRDILQQCLENLDGIYPYLEVIVVDNGSIDGAQDMVESNFPWVRLIRYENNGLSAALNKGLEIATGNYYYYMGNDTFPEKGAMEALVSYFEKNPEVGAATTKLVARDGSIDWDAHRGFPTPWTSFTHFTGLEKIFPQSRLFAGYSKTYEDLNTIHEIDATITHSLFVRKEAQDKAGKWDEQFFVYGEDIDMCFRIKAAGYKIMYIPTVQAVHWKGVNVGRKISEDVKVENILTIKGKTVSSGEFRIHARRKSTEAMRIFYDKHYKDQYPFFITWLVHFVIYLQTQIRVFMQKRRNKKLGYS